MVDLYASLNLPTRVQWNARGKKVHPQDTPKFESHVE